VTKIILCFDSDRIRRAAATRRLAVERASMRFDDEEEIQNVDFAGGFDPPTTSTK